MTRRRLLRQAGLLGGATFAGGLLAACNETPQSTAEEPSSAPGAASTDSAASAAPSDAIYAFSMAISAFPAGGPSLPYIMGIQHPELLEEYGLSLAEEDIIPALSGGDVMRNLALGDLDFGVGAAVASVESWQAGVPIQVIASYGAGTIGWIVPSDSPLQSLEDMRGKRLSMTSPLSTTNAAAVLALQEIGLIDEVELVPTGGVSESWAAVQRGVVDAAWTNSFAQVPFIQSGDAKSIGLVTDYAPNYVDDFIITSVSAATGRADTVQAFIDAYQGLAAAIREDPERAAQAYADFTDTSVEEAAIAIDSLPEQYYEVAVQPDYLQATQDAMQLMGLLEEPIEGWPSLVSQDFLPEDARTDIPETLPLSQ